MSRQQRYYIKLSPVRRGQAPRFVEVDPVTLSLDTVCQLWVRDHSSRDASAAFRPVHGAEALVNRGLDVVQLEETVRDIFDQYRDVFAGLGEIGQNLWSETIEQLGFTNLIQALAEGHVGHANEVLQSTLYGLLSTLSNLAARLEESIRSAVVHEDVYDKVIATTGEFERIEEQFAVKWAIAASTVVSVVARLSEIEANVSKFREHAANERAEWSELIRDENEIAQSLGFLEGDQDQDGFLITAFDYLQDSSSRSREFMEDLVARAQEHVRKWRAVQQDAQIAWKELYDAHDQEILLQQAEMDNLLVDLQEASGHVRDYEAQFGDKTIRPYVFEGGKLITHEEYSRAERHLRDPQWSPRNCERRIGSLFAAAFNLVSSTEPRLPDDLCRVLNDTERCIKQVERMWRIHEESSLALTASGVEQVGRLTASAITAGMPSSSEDAPLAEPTEPASEAVVVINEARADELYEQVICVALVLTCNFYPQAGSTSQSMLQVLAQLNRCTPEEARAYRSAITARISDSEYCETVAELKQVTGRWRCSRMRWLACPWFRGDGTVRHQRKYKLTEASIEFADALLARYNLTREGIRRAYTDARQASRNRRKDEKAVQ